MIMMIMMIMTQKFVDPKFFLTQKFFGSKFFFLTQNFFWPKIFFDPKNFFTQFFFLPHFLPGNKNEYGETVVSRQEGGHSYQVLEDGPGTRYSLRNRVHLSQQPKKQEFAEPEPSKKPRVPLPRGQAEEFNMTWPSTPTGWPHPGDGPGTRACDVCQQCVTIPLQNILGYHYSGTEIHRHKRVRRFLDSLSVDS